MSATCENCRFYAEAIPEEGANGTCRRRAPRTIGQLVPMPSQEAPSVLAQRSAPPKMTLQWNTLGVFPPVSTHYWCGEHEPRINA